MMHLMRRPVSGTGTSLFSDFDQLFDDLWQPFKVLNAAQGLPAVDIYSEDDRHIVVEMPTPGYDRDDISINVRDGVLEISGERADREDANKRKRSYMVRESSMNFMRRITLPKGTDAEHITAELDQGVLKVTIPVEQPQARRIEIAAGTKRKPAKLSATTDDKSN